MQSGGAHFEARILPWFRERTAGLLALTAILLHVAVPTAYELSPATAGLLKTVICSGGLAKEVYLDKDGKPVHPEKTSHNDCKFSCLHHCAALGVSALAVVAPSWAILLNVFTSSERSWAEHHGVSNPRGPPL
jgi:hypothetical protein